ncbi:GDSL-type esterase/lipase family protein [Nonomuraea lactucae]|uniref:GDSL-type esterase/lipase family protein n=1 Tax=Nonomuraea lactucae TaxID=2249762 RepID=UPI001F05948E|nr:GDSL-type esterase/lipase family protein [Nonomuraea lactucae]
MAIVLTLSLTKIPAQAQSACGLSKSSRAAMSGSVSIRCGAEAKAAGSTLNVADGDLLIEFTFDNVDADALRTTVEEHHQDELPLSEAINRVYEASNDEFPDPGFSFDGYDFDGTLEARSDGVTFVIFEDDVHVELALWVRTVIAMVAGYAARILSYAMCIPWFSGAPPLAVLWCSNLSAGVQAVTVLLVGYALVPGSTPSTKEVVLAAFAAFIVGTLGNGIWEGIAKPWLTANMRTVLIDVGLAIADLAKKSYGWFTSVIRSGLTIVANLVIEYAPQVLDYILRKARQVGLSVTVADVRLMPLGDSITQGVGSSTSEGYRAPLYERLKWLGRDVDFAGSLEDGSFADNDHEGHSGWRIDQIQNDAADCAVPAYRPNVVTLHAGTNDMNQDYQLATAPERLGGLIDQVLDDAPDATVLVATLVPATKEGLQPRIDAYNARIPAIVKQRQDQGKHVQLVEMDEVTTADLSQPAHPGDSGYRKMADAWYEALVTVEQKGWIADPVAGSLPGPWPDPADGSEPVADNPGVLSCTADVDQSKAGPGWRALGVIATGMSTPEGRTDIMELDGDNRGDYVRIADGGGFRIARNTPGQPGQPNWVDQGTFVVDNQNPGVGTRVRFADMNGDGRDDYLVLGEGETASVTAWYSVVAASGATVWQPRGVIAPGVSGAGRESIRFADVNGDGRDDFLRVSDAAAIHAYINTPTATGGIIRFADVNGDGRDDFLRVSDAAAIHAYINTPTATGGIHWVERLNWAPGVSYGTRDKLRLADVNGDRRADYLMVDSTGRVHAYINNGGGGGGGFTPYLNYVNSTDYPGEKVAFRDISGDGKADYLVIYTGGSIRAWLNIGGNTGS